MKTILGPLKFVQVLPSAFIILGLGIMLSVFFGDWLGDWTPAGKLGALVWPAGVALGAAIYALSYLLSTSPRLLTASMKELLQTLHNLFQNLTWPQIVILSLLAGIGEELLIRGVLQSWLTGVTTPAAGIIAASLIFGLLHYMTKTYVLLTFVLGLMFGVAFHLSDSILLVMVAHTVYDIFAFAMIVKFPHMLGLESQHGKINIIRESSF